MPLFSVFPMIAASFKLTNEKPSVQFDCKEILFDKLVIRSGEIESIAFHLAWKTYDPLDRCQVAHDISLTPSSYIEEHSVGREKVYHFRKDNYPPVYRFNENCGEVTLSATIQNGKSFDLNVYVDITESK